MDAPKMELKRPSRSQGSPADEEVIEHIRGALRGLRFGTVTILVQDGTVIQIDRTEKLRLR